MKDNPAAETATDCQSRDGHAEHLCRLVEQGRTADVLIMSAHPEFRCGNCGAVANLANALCRPRPI